jgi:hypothetical protein
MPKQPMDYSRTVIYKICCNDLNVTDVYVGHTTNFNKRKWGHKQVCNNEKSRDHNLKVYKTIRANGGWNEWSMIQICKYPCSSIQEATAKEREFYELLNAKMNMDCPNRTKQQWHGDNKIRIKNIRKNWFQKNKTLILEQRKKNMYTCQCGSNIQKCQKTPHEKTKKHISFIQNNPVSQELEV